jgi:hypothetical protein
MPHRRLKNSARHGIAAALLAGAALAPAFSADESPRGAIPNFAPDMKTGWQLTDDDFVLPEGGGPGPVVSDPRYPYISFYRYPTNPRPTFRVADLNNVILQPSTKAALQKANEKSLSGQVIAVPKERCWPVGVPAFLLYPATPVYFFQTPKEVLLVWMQDHQVRRVRLNEQHAPNERSQWFGDSIGHYEGDTLVVDTIGLSPRTYVDNFFTPHSDQLHVVERFRMIEGGRTLEVKVHVEDPQAFTTPWNAVQLYRRMDNGPMVETVCAENNDDHFDHNIGPMPTAEKPDF